MINRFIERNDKKQNKQKQKNWLECNNKLNALLIFFIIRPLFVLDNEKIKTIELKEFVAFFPSKFPSQIMYQ